MFEQHGKLRKYPRTFHFSWSEALQNDDRQLESDDIFVGKEVVVTEKLDGENTTMHNDKIHARSLSSGYHPSRNWVKSLHDSFAHEIPDDIRICGENVFAKHSIHYKALTSYFYVFGVYAGDMCLSWDDTLEYADLFGLKVVPELYRGPWDEEIVKACYTGKSKFGAEQEGYVVRVTHAFPYDQHDKHVGKFVRKGHVQTDQNWMYQQIIPNECV